MKSNSEGMIKRDFSARIIVGSGLFWAWTDCYYLSAFFPESNAGSHTFFTSPFFAVAGVALFSCLCFVAILIWSGRGDDQPSFIDRFLGKLNSSLICAVLCTVGSFCIILTNWYPSSLFAIFGTLLTGIGSGFLFFFWGREYGTHGARSACIAVPAAFVCAIIIDTPLLAMMEVPRAIFFSLLPVFSALFIVFGRKQEPISEEDRASRKAATSLRTTLLSSGKAKEFFYVPVAIIAGVLLFTFAHGFMQYVVIYSPGSAVESGIFMQYSRGVAALLLLVAIVVFFRRGFQVYRVGFLVAIGGFLIIPLAIIAEQPNSFLIAGMIVTAGYTWFDAYIWSVVCELSDFSEKPNWKPLALIRLCFAVGQVLGMSLGFMSVATEGFGGLFAQAAIICIYLLVIAVFLLLSNDSNIWTMLKLSVLGPSEEGAEKDRQYHIALFCSTYGLSTREAEVLELILNGRSVRKIADDMAISEHTVVSHIRHMYQKTDCHSRQELIDLAYGAEEVN